MANGNYTYGPTPIDVGTTPAPVGPLDRGPAPVPPSPALGYVPVVNRPVVPQTEQPVEPSPGLGVSQTSSVPAIPQVELPVDTTAGANVEAGPNITPGNQQRYITVLANGAVITNNAISLDFLGNGVTVSAAGTTGANILINTSSGSSYSNANVSAFLAAFGSNVILTAGNITGGNVLTSAEVIANGVIQSGTGFSTGGYLSVNGDADLHNTTVTGNLSATGNVTGNYILGNGSQLTGLPATYSNANVQTYLPTYSGNVGALTVTGNLTVTGTTTTVNTEIVNVSESVVGNIDAGNLRTAGQISAAGNITGNFFIGNGSALSSLTGGNVSGTVANATYALNSNAATYATQATTADTANAVAGANVSGTVANATYATSAGSATTATTVTNGAQANITSVGTLTSLSVSGNITAANLGNIASLNLNSNASTVLYGNGTFASLPASSSYGNSNVTTLLGNLGSNVISSTGNISTTANISGNYILGNGSQLTSLPLPAVTQDITSNGAMSIMLYDGTIKYNNYATVEPSSGNIAGNNISASGNITGNYFIGNGSQLTGINASSNYIVNGNSYANIATANGNLDINVGNDGYGIWTFVAGTGNLVGPGNASQGAGIVFSADQSVYIREDMGELNIDSGSGITVTANSGNVGNTQAWTFDAVGNLTIPGNILGSGNILIAPDSASSSSYLDIYLTGGPDIHIASNDNSIVIGRDTGANIFVGNDGDVSIRTDNGTTAQVWNFDDTGNLTLPGNTFAVNYANGTAVSLGGGGNASTGNVTFNDVNIIGTGNLKLQPDSANANAYLDIYLTAGPDIHIAGNGETVILGTDDYANVAVNIDGNVSIQAGNGSGTQTWNFGTDGLLTFPTGNLVITPDDPAGNIASIVSTDHQLAILSTGANGAVATVWVEDIGNVGTSNIAAVYANPTSGSKIVRIAVGQNGSPGPNLWDFDAAGNLAVPGNINFSGDASAAPSLNDFFSVTSAANFAVVTDSANTDQTWTFGTTGNLTLPGNAFAVNYANGTAVSLDGNYSNANVVANVAALGSNPVSTTGNVTGGNLLFGSGIISGTGNITGGNLDLSYMGGAAKGNLTGGNISVTGNITGGNLLTGGIFSASGNISTGGNITTAGAVSASSTITGANLSTSGTVSATGNVAGGNIVTGGLITATGNITTAGNILNQGFVSSTGNAIHGNILTGGLVSAAGNITASNVFSSATMSTGGNIFAALNISATGTVYGSNFNTTGLISATANITGGNVLTGGLLSATATITGGNLLTVGLISATGNITGGNISATNHTGTTVSVTGNITGGNLLTGGLISAAGNITGGNVLTAGQVSATGNITTANSFVGNLVGTTVSITGNVSAGNVIVNGQPTTYGYVNGAYLLAQNTTDQSVGLDVAVNFQTTSASNGSIITKTSNSQVTLTAGNTYKLEGIIRRLSSSSTWAAFRWYDVTNSAYVGIEGFSEVTNATGAIGSTNVATYIVTPTVNTIYELRQTTVNTISVSGGYAGYEITQINPAIAVQATATGTVAATVVANTSPDTTTTTGGSSVSPALTVLTVAIPSAGTWRLDAELRAYIPGAGYMAAAFYDNGTVISGSEYFVAAGGVTQTGAATGQYGGFMSYNLTTTSARTVTLGFWSTTSSQFISSDDGRTWLRATQIDSIFALNALATMSVTGNITTTGNVSATGNVTGGNVLTGGVISSTGNITGGNISATNHTGTTVSVTGNITGGNLLTGGLISAAGNITAANFFGNGNTLSNVATRFESSWTVPVGNSTQSFTVAASETYYLWVDCNIPNGILAWNATATVTNTNVPVVGAQYAWVYNGGGSPIDFTSIPNQFVGTANTILRSSVAPSATTNRFDFGLNNTSGGNVTVRYGWVAIS